MHSKNGIIRIFYPTDSPVITNANIQCSSICIRQSNNFFTPEIYSRLYSASWFSYIVIILPSFLNISKKEEKEGKKQTTETDQLQEIHQQHNKSICYHYVRLQTALKPEIYHCHLCLCPWQWFLYHWLEASASYIFCLNSSVDLNFFWCIVSLLSHRQLQRQKKWPHLRAQNCHSSVHLLGTTLWHIHKGTIICLQY